MNIDLILYNVKVKLQAQISRSYLGYLWWIFEPIGVIAAFYFVFEFLLKRGGPEYTYQLVVGVVAWTWFGATASQAATSIHRASNLMLQVRVNKLLFPITEVLELSFKQLFVFLLLFLFLAVSKGVQPTWFYFPLVLLEQLLFISAVSFSLAAVVPFTPDIIYLVNITMRLWLFCSGVFYTVESISPDYQFYFLLNPMANIIEQYREILIYNQPPDWLSILVITSVSCTLLAVAVAVINQNDKAYPRLSLQ